MDREVRLYLFVIILAVLFILTVIWYRRSVLGERRRIDKVKQQYDKAIHEGNKRLALQLGREYYSMLRGGQPSVYDEQAIANDLSTIDSIGTKKGNN